tara:strand:+ start:149 stop:358 length:210 start_codon:yes stop_codon:yes gene_type:complete
MADDLDVRMMQIREVSTRLFGDSSDSNRKRVRKLIKDGILKGRKLSNAPHAPNWITQKSFYQFIADLDS